MQLQKSTNPVCRVRHDHIVNKKQDSDFSSFVCMFVQDEALNIAWTDG